MTARAADPATRVLFVTWDGPQVSYLETLFLPIFAGLQAHGYHFDVLQFRWGTAAQAEAVAHACRDAGSGYRAVRVWRGGGSLGPFASALRGGTHLRQAADAFGSHLLMPRSVLPSLAMLAGQAWRERPVLLDSDGLEVDERVEFAGLSPTGLAYRLLRDVEGQAVRRAAGVLARTPWGRDVLVARGGAGVAVERCHVVGNGRDETLFSPGDEASRQDMRARLGVPANAPLIAYAGSIGAKYRTDRVAAFATAVRRRRPDAHLLFLTGSPEQARQDLFRAAPELEAVTILKRVAPEDVPSHLATADIGAALITPTFSMRAAAPVKTGEYLLCGLPVLGDGAVGDNAGLIAAGVFRDDAGDVEAAAEWFTDAVLADRETYRGRARAAGLAQFSLASSVEAYRVALDATMALGRSPDRNASPKQGERD